MSSKAPHGVPPGRARRRAFAGQAAAIGAYLAFIGGLTLAARAGHLPMGAFLPLGLVATALVLFSPALAVQMGNAEISPARLTVYTMTGQRTLDLTALRRVRRLVVPTKGPAPDIDLIFVTDARGVRAGLRSRDALAAISRSLTPRTRVSWRAGHRLLGRRASAPQLILFYFLLPLLCYATLWMFLSVLALLLAYPDQ